MGLHRSNGAILELELELEDEGWRMEEGKNTKFMDGEGQMFRKMFTVYDFLFVAVFTDDAWPDGEERIYLMWDCIEVPGLFHELEDEGWRKVRTLNLWMEKDRCLGKC